MPPWRQPRGKSMVAAVNSHTNATSKRWHLWEIDLRFAPGSPPGWVGSVEGDWGGFSAAPISALVWPHDAHALPAAASRVVTASPSRASSQRSPSFCSQPSGFEPFRTTFPRPGPRSGDWGSGMNMHPQLLATLLFLALAPPCHLSPPLLHVALPASSPPNGRFLVSAARWGTVGWRCSGSLRALVLRGGGDVATGDGGSEEDGKEEWSKEHVAPEGSAVDSLYKHCLKLTLCVPEPTTVQGYLAHKKQPTSLGRTYGPRHKPSVGC